MHQQGLSLLIDGACHERTGLGGGMMINNNNKKNDNNNNYINHDDEDDDEYGHDTRAQREAQRYNNQRLCTTVVHVRETRYSKRARTIKLRM